MKGEGGRGEGTESGRTGGGGRRNNEKGGEEEREGKEGGGCKGGGKVEVKGKRREAEGRGRRGAVQEHVQNR